MTIEEAAAATFAAATIPLIAPMELFVILGYSSRRVHLRGELQAFFTTTIRTQYYLQMIYVYKFPVMAGCSYNSVVQIKAMPSPILEGH
jgi:hypothetical protein